MLILHPVHFSKQAHSGGHMGQDREISGSYDLHQDHSSSVSDPARSETFNTEDPWFLLPLGFLCLLLAGGEGWVGGRWEPRQPFLEVYCMPSF